MTPPSPTRFAFREEAPRHRLHLDHPVRNLRLAQAPDPARDEQWQQQLRAQYELGLRDGEKGLREQLLQQRAEVMELQKGLFASIERALPQVRNECETTLVDLALEVARKLVAGLPVKAEMVEAAIREALDNIEEARDVCVLVNDADFKLLQRLASPVLKATVAGEKIRCEASPEVTRGGCLIQTRFGVVDARRETKFSKIKKSLRS